MYAEISAAIQSVASLNEILRATKELRDRNDLVAAVSQVNEKLMLANGVALESQEKQAALSNEVRELQSKLAELERWETEIQRYEMHRFATGALAYRLKPSTEQGEPTHFLCPDCVSNRKATKLQPLRNGITLRCHVCGLKIEIEKREAYAASTSHDRGGWM